MLDKSKVRYCTNNGPWRYGTVNTEPNGEIVIECTDNKEHSLRFKADAKIKFTENGIEIIGSVRVLITYQREFFPDHPDPLIELDKGIDLVKAIHTSMEDSFTHTRLSGDHHGGVKLRFSFNNKNYIMGCAERSIRSIGNQRAGVLYLHENDYDPIKD